MSEEIDDVKKVLRSLLVTVPNGMCVTELQREFRQMEGRNIPCGRFNSIIEFLDSIPETVRVSDQIVNQEIIIRLFRLFYAFIIVCNMHVKW